MKDMVNDEEEGDRVTYVRLPGTSQVAEVAFYDGEDQIMERNLNAVDSRRVIDKGVFRCMVQPVILRKKIKFLMDTGCGHDLISQKKIERHDLETLVTPGPISFQTANGITDTDLVSNFQASVLSVGKRCMNQNYGFVWPPGREPFMIDPDGKRITLFVNGDIPYIRVGSSKSLAHDDVEATAVLNSAHVKEEVAAAAQAVPGEIDGEEEEDGEEHARQPDPDPHEVPGEEIPSEGAGRPPDPSGGGVGDIPLHGDDDEREIQVEGEGAPPRKAKVGTLKAEANTLAHLCTHRYRNPHCESCIRAKMKHFRTRRGACQRELKSWGDLITYDFLDMRKAADAGLGIDDGAREVLVIRDIATKMIAAIQTESRHTEQVVSALKRLIGRRKVKMAYSDAAPEFEAAMSELRIPLDHSLLGNLNNNSLAERTNQEIINTVATAMQHAGLPAQYWSFALNCVTHNLNIEDVEGDGDSAWKRMTGDDFKGKAIPFGAKVFFKPTDTRKRPTATSLIRKGSPAFLQGTW